MYCSSCGYNCPDNVNYCPVCGASLMGQNALGQNQLNGTQYTGSQRWGGQQQVAPGQDWGSHQQAVPGQNWGSQQQAVPGQDWGSQQQAAPDESWNGMNQNALGYQNSPKKPGFSGDKWMMISIFSIFVIIIAGIAMILAPKMLRDSDSSHGSKHSGENEATTAAEIEATDDYVDSTEMDDSYDDTADGADGETVDAVESDDGEEEDGNDAPDASNAYIDSIYASSYLDEEEEFDVIHDPEKAIDGDPCTAWCEDAEGNGTGESITIKLKEQCVLHGIYIMNGYHKDEGLYEKNARAKSIEVSLSNGISERFSLDDVMDWQTLELTNKYTVDEITITILGVYEGSKYEDTLISEIEIY